LPRPPAHSTRPPRPFRLVFPAGGGEDGEVDEYENKTLEERYWTAEDNEKHDACNLELHKSIEKQELLACSRKNLKYAKAGLSQIAP